MQEGKLLLATPVPAVERIRPHQVQRAGDGLALVQGQHQDHPIPQPLAEQGEE